MGATGHHSSMLPGADVRGVACKSPGIVRMKELAQSYCWWPNVDLEIEHMVRNCGKFQLVRKPPPVVPLVPWVWPSKPWHCIHIDYAENVEGHYLSCCSCCTLSLARDRFHASEHYSHCNNPNLAEPVSKIWFTGSLC